MGLSSVYGLGVRRLLGLLFRVCARVLGFGSGVVPRVWGWAGWFGLGCQVVGLGARVRD